MADRSSVKEKHENFHVGNFVNWLNDTYRCNYSVIDKPEPPDAIIQSGTTIRWVEISTSFMSPEFARDEFSFATPGEVHRPMDTSLIKGPDASFAKQFCSVVKAKLEKKSYLPVTRKYGPGYLVIPIRYPLFTASTIDYMKQRWVKLNIDNLGCFRSVRFTYQSMGGWKFQLWRL